MVHLAIPLADIVGVLLFLMMQRPSSCAANSI